jgi:hypothetical protein
VTGGRIVRYDRPGGLLHASVASNDRAWFVWTDSRNSAGCLAVDAFRASSGPKPNAHFSARPTRWDVSSATRTSLWERSASDSRVPSRASQARADPHCHTRPFPQAWLRGDQHGRGHGGSRRLEASALPLLRDKAQLLADVLRQLIPQPGPAPAGWPEPPPPSSEVQHHEPASWC